MLRVVHTAEMGAFETLQESRNFGVRKIADKHIIDFGKASTGGFTLAELDKYLDDIFLMVLSRLIKKLIVELFLGLPRIMLLSMSVLLCVVKMKL